VPNLNGGTEIPLLLLWPDLFFVYTSLCVKGMNERISHFGLAIVPFEFYRHNYTVLLAFSSSENQKLAEFSKCRFLVKKIWTITHEKCHFLLNMDFLVKKNQKPPLHLQIYMKKAVPRIYRMIPRRWGFGEQSTDLRVTGFQSLF
jgi:hypothetical protein